MSETKPEYKTRNGGDPVLPPQSDGAKRVRAIEIRAEVRQVKTMADHTVNVVLNLPEDCIKQAQLLLGWQGDEVNAVIENVT